MTDGDAVDKDLGSICGRGTGRAISVFICCSDVGKGGRQGMRASRWVDDEGQMVLAVVQRVQSRYSICTRLTTTKQTLTRLTCQASDVPIVLYPTSLFSFPLPLNERTRISYYTHVVYCTSNKLYFYYPIDL